MKSPHGKSLLPRTLQSSLRSARHNLHPLGSAESSPSQRRSPSPWLCLPVPVPVPHSPCLDSELSAQFWGCSGPGSVCLGLVSV